MQSTFLTRPIPPHNPQHEFTANTESLAFRNSLLHILQVKYGITQEDIEYIDMLLDFIYKGGCLDAMRMALSGVRPAQKSTLSDSKNAS